MRDFELSMLEALTQIYPATPQIGCLFHLSVKVFKHAQELGFNKSTWTISVLELISEWYQHSASLQSKILLLRWTNFPTMHTRVQNTHSHPSIWEFIEALNRDSSHNHLFMAQWHFHMLGVRGCTASQGVLFEDMCSLRHAFQPHSKLCVPLGYTISRFLVVFYVLSGSGSGSPCGTTPSILVPSAPPPPPW